MNIIENIIIESANYIEPQLLINVNICLDKLNSEFMNDNLLSSDSKRLTYSHLLRFGNLE